MLAVPPKVLHYGLHWEVGKTGYEFDKHWFYDFDALQCPPWNLSANSKGGLFKHPPHPATYPTKVSNVRIFCFYIISDDLHRLYLHATHYLAMHCVQNQ